MAVCEQPDGSVGELATAWEQQHGRGLETISRRGCKGGGHWGLHLPESSTERSRTHVIDTRRRSASVSCALQIVIAVCAASHNLTAARHSWLSLETRAMQCHGCGENCGASKISMSSMGMAPIAACTALWEDDPLLLLKAMALQCCERVSAFVLRAARQATAPSFRSCSKARSVCQCSFPTARVLPHISHSRMPSTFSNVHVRQTALMTNSGRAIPHSRLSNNPVWRESRAM
jgi:hypothetical protein